MPELVISEVTFRRLFTHAHALRVSIEDVINSGLDLSENRGGVPPSSPLPLTGDAWQAARDEWVRAAESRAGRYPPGFVLDDSRETMYREREDAQL